MDCSTPDSSVREILQARIWSGQLFSSPDDLPNLGTKPVSPTLHTDSLPSEAPGNQTMQ